MLLSTGETGFRLQSVSPRPGDVQKNLPVKYESDWEVVSLPSFLGDAMSIER